MSDLSDSTRIESIYVYEILVNNSDHLERYYANSLNLESEAYVSFVPLYEIAGGREREVGGVELLVPYRNVIKIIHRTG